MTGNPSTMQGWASGSMNNGRHTEVDNGGYASYREAMSMIPIEDSVLLSYRQIVDRLTGFLNDCRRKWIKARVAELGKSDVKISHELMTVLKERLRGRYGADEIMEAVRTSRIDSLDMLAREDLARIGRRARKLYYRNPVADPTRHLDDEERCQLAPVLTDASAIYVGSEDMADRIAAELHESSPWMAKASDILWKAMRRSALEGQPFSVGPMLLHGYPGTGKTYWATNLARMLNIPHCVVDVSQGLASHSLAGTERGWASKQPGLPLQTMVSTQTVNPLIVVDDVCRAAYIRGRDGVSAMLQDALLGLLEPGSASNWMCPCYRICFDMSHISWILLANRPERMDPALINRCRVIEIERPSARQMADFAHRQAMKAGLPEDMVESIGNMVLCQTGKKADQGFSLRHVMRLIQDARDIRQRPILH